MVVHLEMGCRCRYHYPTTNADGRLLVNISLCGECRRAGIGIGVGDLIWVIGMYGDRLR